MTHACGVGPGWKRGYDYHPGSNRLRATSVDPDVIEDPANYTDASYEHDEHGNMTAMSAIPGGLTWDEDDRLQKTDDVGGGITYYVYDGAGQRVRKVHLNDAETTRKQRLYSAVLVSMRQMRPVSSYTWRVARARSRTGVVLMLCSSR